MLRGWWSGRQITEKVCFNFYKVKNAKLHDLYFKNTKIRSTSIFKSEGMINRIQNRGYQRREEDATMGAGWGRAVYLKDWWCSVS